MFFTQSRFFFSAKEKEKKERNFIVSTITALIFVSLVMWLWPEVIPFSFWELWIPKGGIGLWLYAGLPLFIWGVVVNIVHLFFFSDRFNLPDLNAAGVFVGGTVISVWAGVVEEIAFRWLIFLSAIVGVQITNFLFFGCLGFGIAEWFHLNVAGPLTDLVSFGYLRPYLFSDAGWYVGAGMLSANAFFRDGHKYQGIVGYINSWGIGLFLFWVTFNYGLLAAILIHFFYDFLILSVIGSIYTKFSSSAYYKSK